MERKNMNQRQKVESLILDICTKISNVKTIPDMQKIYNVWANKRNQLIEKHRYSLKIGDKCEFNTKKGLIKGKITKINKKTIKVMADSGTLWTVSINLVRHDRPEYIDKWKSILDE